MTGVRSVGVQKDGQNRIMENLYSFYKMEGI